MHNRENDANQLSWDNSKSYKYNFQRGDIENTSLWKFPYDVLSAKTFTSAVLLYPHASYERKNCNERVTSQNWSYKGHNYLIL